MKQFRVTIYSPADGEEHNFTADSERLEMALQVLTASAEVGAWVKVERIADGS
jgi:hypothetical protein